MIRRIQIACRTLFNRPLYALLNIGGLAIGLAVSALLFLWVQDEYGYDGFHRHADQIYKVNTWFESGGKKEYWESTQGSVGPHALESVPGVEEAVRVLNGEREFRYDVGGKTIFERENFYVDPSFFKMFDFPIVKGSVFRDLQSVVITESAAEAFFGKEEAVGKTLLVDKNKQFTVAGVIRDLPANSNIKGRIFYPMGIRKAEYSSKYWKGFDDDWGNFYMFTYLRLKPGIDVKQVNAGIDRNWKTANPGPEGFKFGYLLMPLQQQHLYRPDGQPGQVKIVKSVAMVGIVILLIACINYVNLATARAHQRTAEISVRKMIGASKAQLFRQVFGESAIVFGTALLVALLLIWVMTPFYGQVTGKELSLSLQGAALAKSLGVSMLAMIALSAIYPALKLAALEPLRNLRSKSGKSGGWLRKGLVVTQFAVSIVLIGSTFVISKQLQYMQTEWPGYDRENVFVAEAGKMSEHKEAVTQQLLNSPGVKAVAFAGTNITYIDNSTGDLDWEGKSAGQNTNVRYLFVNEQFIPALRLEMKEGRNFRAGKADSAGFVLNEEAVRVLGLKNPVGMRFKMWETQGQVIGVVKDFHFGSFREKIMPLAMYYSSAGANLFVRTDGRNAEALAAVEGIWKQYNPDYAFHSSFLADTNGNLYLNEKRTSALFSSFAVVAIFLSCLGLFGLATFAIGQRTKEIGIRKVLGASIPGILRLLTKDFLKPVLVAIAVATPIGLYAMNEWLGNFAYGIGLPWWIFLAAGGMAVAVALITIGAQSLKAALANPVQTLKTD